MKKETKNLHFPKPILSAMKARIVSSNLIKPAMQL